MHPLDSGELSPSGGPSHPPTAPAQPRAAGRTPHQEPSPGGEEEDRGQGYPPAEKGRMPGITAGLESLSALARSWCGAARQDGPTQHPAESNPCRSGRPLGMKGS